MNMRILSGNADMSRLQRNSGWKRRSVRNAWMKKTESFFMERKHVASRPGKKKRNARRFAQVDL